MGWGGVGLGEVVGGTQNVVPYRASHFRVHRGEHSEVEITAKGAGKCGMNPIQ